MIFSLVFLVPIGFGRESCDKVLERLFNEAKASGKARSSLDEVAPELKPIITEIVRSGTRTPAQRKALAQEIEKYLRENGVKTRLDDQGTDGIDIIVEEVSKDSPFAWAKNVPDNLANRFNQKILGIFNTEVILNPYTPGFRGGSAQYRFYYYEKKAALVYSAKGLMTKRFHASTDGHEAIHAVTHNADIPRLVIRPQRSKLDGKVGADLYGREFASDEIHSAYPFSVRTSLRTVEPGVPQEEKKEDAFTEIEMTVLRNAVLQGLYETAQPAYEVALQPGAIKKSTIYDTGGFGGNRALSIKTGDNTVNFFFDSEQVNRWKLKEDPSASKEVDWSKDPKTVRALIERDFFASKRAAKESNWLIDNLTGPNPTFTSYREATNRLGQLRDFSVIGDKNASRQEREEAALRIVERGQGEKASSEAEKKQLAKKIIQMQKAAAKDQKELREGALAVQKSNGSWMTVDANNPTQESPAVRLIKLLQK